jgi:glutathione S-transferase
VPTDLVERVAPALNAHAQRIANLPGVLAYYAQFAPK